MLIRLNVEYSPWKVEHLSLSPSGSLRARDLLGHSVWMSLAVLGDQQEVS